MRTPPLRRRSALAAGLLAVLLGAPAMAQITPIPDKVRPVVADRQDAQVPDRVQVAGWLGQRLAASESNRLVKVDTARLLEGYRRRPGRQAWDGEHVGKWLHAATLAWAATGDPALRAKLDETAAELCKCQLPDGYLGTYLDQDRWTEWDVWAHKYNLLGLLTYVRLTGNTAPMPTCRRMADLLIATFGEAPGQRDILAAGHHAGMAPTSVLEPMALLYRMTGDARDLKFCAGILKAWERPAGPHIVSRLLAKKGVDQVGNAKAYEMLSCLNGALELYRTTGDRRLLDAGLLAWQDIVDHRLYVTGAASACELFRPQFDLPNNNNVGETCVTVTWIQLNTQLLRLTGEARFADQLELVVLNQLLGAQQPDGSAWGYYVQMEGTKPYSASLDGHCCLSSGPRGLALVPTFAVTTDQDGVVINLLEAASARLTLRDGTPVTVNIETMYPVDGHVRVTVQPARPHPFALKIRTPGWCTASTSSPPGALRGQDGYTTWTRTWSPGDSADLNLKLEPRVILGDHLNQGKAALCFGPLVLAADETLAPDQAFTRLALPGADLAKLAITPQPAPPERRTWPGAQCFLVSTVMRSSPANTPAPARLIPFADAGATGGRYKVWLPLADRPSANLLAAGAESRSRPGNQAGSILDDDLNSHVVTFDGQKPSEDWFAVTLPAPAAASRIVFTHGKNYHDGGWFDTSAGKPRVQVQHAPGGLWETVGELADYPATTAAKGDHERLTWSNRQFTLKLAAPVTFTALRVVGTPACGDNPDQAFSSCAELQAFRD